MPDEENQARQSSETESPILAVVDRAREEVAWVRSAYKFAVSIIAILIAIGLYFSHKSIQDLKSDLRADGERTQKQIQTESELLARSLQQDLKDEISRIRGEVTSRIDVEFKEENISSLVEQQAQARIDQIADNLIEKQISERIVPLKTDLTALISKSSADVSSKLEELDEKIKQSRLTEEDLRTLLAQARTTLNTVKEQSDFVLTVLAAQSDDRRAFERLQQWAADGAFALHEQAKSAELDILKSHSGFLNDAHMSLSWVDGFDPKEMSLNDITRSWRAIDPMYARAYIEFVWKHEKLSKEEKLTFLFNALKDSRGSMQAADWAAKTLAKEAKVKYNPPFKFTAIEEWWETRKETNSIPEEATNRMAGD